MNPREGEGHAQISAAVTLVLFCVMIGQGPASAQVGHVKGTATYRERMALPPNAVFEATLEDVSRADAPSEIVGQTRIEGPGNPPIRFEISYDPSRINPKNRYTVRARILVGGRLFFTSDQSYPVLTGGQGNEVEVLLRRAGSGPASGGAGSLGRLSATFDGDLPCADCPGAPSAGAVSGRGLLSSSALPRQERKRRLR